MEINEVLARNLSTLREQQNLSLGQLAQISGLSKVMLSQLEKGTDSGRTGQEKRELFFVRGAFGKIHPRFPLFSG